MGRAVDRLLDVPVHSFGDATFALDRAPKTGTIPVTWIRDGKLFGRGGADDGYAIFATITAIRTLQQQQLPHSRIVVMIECCEESGSVDLPAYIDLLAARIGRIDIQVDDVFENTLSLSAPYKVANGLHISTHLQTLRQQLLFRSGEPFHRCTHTALSPKGLDRPRFAASAGS